MKKETVDNIYILNIVTDIGEYNRTIKDLKKDSPDEINELEEAVIKYIAENDLEILETRFSDKWKHLFKKFAYPYEYFKSIEDYQKPVDNIKKEHFFSKLKNGYPDHGEIGRTMDINRRFNIINGEELTEIDLKSDVLLLACVFEKFVKVSVNEFGINPLCCVSLPGFTWWCVL